MSNLPELPEIKTTDVKTLRTLTSAGAKALPSMPRGEMPMSRFTNARQLEAEQMAAEMRYVYNITRKINKFESAKSKAQSYQAQKQAEKSQISNKFVDR